MENTAKRDARTVRWTEEEAANPSLDWAALRWLTNSIKLEDHQEGTRTIDVAVRQFYALPLEQQTVIACMARRLTQIGIDNLGVKVALEIVCAVAMQQTGPVENLAIVQCDSSWTFRSSIVADRLDTEESKVTDAQDVPYIRGLRRCLGLSMPEDNKPDRLTTLIRDARMERIGFQDYRSLQERIEHARGRHDRPMRRRGQDYA